MKTTCDVCGKDLKNASFLIDGICRSCQGGPKPSDRILLTAAHQFGSGKRFSEIEVITAECVYGMNIFRDIFAMVRDVVGAAAKHLRKCYEI